MTVIAGISGIEVIECAIVIVCVIVIAVVVGRASTCVSSPRVRGLVRRWW